MALDLVEAFAGESSVVCGSVEKGISLSPEIRVERVRALGSAVGGGRGLERLEGLLEEADVVHVHNIMNPLVLARAAASGKAVVSVQDHRFFCPGAGKETLLGEVCRESMGVSLCRGCFEDSAYGTGVYGLTEARNQALHGAALHVLSRYMERELADVGHPGAQVLPPWIPAADCPSEPGDSVFLGGRLVQHKAPDQGVEAWRRSGIAASLRVGGDGPLAGSPGVEWLGWLSQKALRAELRRARVVLFPARWQEPFGMLAVEALAQGTPVIAMNTGGVEEWAGAGTILVERGDIDAMAQALRNLWTHPDRVVALGKAGWEHVRRHYNPVDLQSRWRALYTQTCS
jgi:glycosyltransferase involved in cell wall biosynthesis